GNDHLPQRFDVPTCAHGRFPVDDAAVIIHRESLIARGWACEDPLRNSGSSAHTWCQSMPRFSANLSFLFNEVPFLERFAEAAHAGFRAVEFAFPYEYQAKELAAEVKAHKLEVVLFNMPPGNYEAGDRGLASLPGREHEFASSVSTALRFAQALKCNRLHVMAGVLPHDADGHERVRRRRIFVRNLKAACEEAAAQNVTLLIE